ncbi:MAG: DUF5683 domain-containing protein [Candidatus Cloacimonadota bacterium]|nr:DUF5683 domain-containing protein [Candidatus Cloacimonadota bacterium]
MKKISIFLVILLFVSASAQEKKPLKAAALSVFIPGGGQYYNEKKIKSAVVCGTELFFIGLTYYQHYKSEDYYDKYEKTLDEKYYNKYLDYYYKKQNTAWWLGASIFLSALDSYVDAHLFDFEEKKRKIHLKFEPEMLGISIRF